jgi:hypothetical protein
VATPAPLDLPEDDKPKATPAEQPWAHGDHRPRKAARRDRRKPWDGGPRTSRKWRTSSLVFVILGVVVVLAGAVGFGVYWLGKSHNSRVSFNAYAKMAEVEQERTRADVEAILGPGRPLTADEVGRIYADTEDARHGPEKWAPKIEQGRAVFWKNGGDYILAAFHPDGAPTSRLQVCVFVGTGIPEGLRSRPGEKAAVDWIGTQNDAEFLRRFPQRAPGSDTGPVEVSAETLARDFQANPDAAPKYSNRTVTVEGKLDMLTDTGGNEIIATLQGVPRPGRGLGFNVWCAMKPGAEAGLFRVSRGQTVRLRGKCVGANDSTVNVTDCEFERAGPETAVATTAAALLSDYARSEKIADPVYKEKQVVVRRCRVVSVDPEGALNLESMLAKPPAVKFRATCTRDLRKRFTTVKPGDVVTIRGECAGLITGEVYLRICSPPEVEPAGPPTDPVPPVRQPPPPPTPSGPILDVPAAVLVKAYADGEKAADAMYKGKWLRVEGPVDTLIGQIGDPDPVEGTTTLTVVGLAGGEQRAASLVRCLLPAVNVRPAMRLSPGQPVKVVGQCVGGHIHGGVWHATLEHARVDGYGPDPALNVPANSLVSDYSRDEKAADAKYKGKFLTLTNAVVESRKDDREVFLVARTAKGRVKVSAYFPWDFQRKVGDLKPGDVISLKCECLGVSDGTVSLVRCRLLP